MSVRDLDPGRPHRFACDLSLFLEVAHENTAQGRRYAAMETEVLPPSSPYHNGELRVTLSPEQAREIICSLWKQLPPEERPCPS